MSPMRSFRSRLLGLLVAATFAAPSAFPGLPHGCEMGGGAGTAAGAVAPGTAPHSSHHHESDSGPRKAPTCQCVGHSCCAGRLFLPTRFAVTLGSPAAVATEPPVWFARLLPTRPRYLLPLAQAPPSVG
jgi:hypothetical protein